MDGERVFRVVEKSADAESMAKKLLRTALDDPKCKDNITIIVATL